MVEISAIYFAVNYVLEHYENKSVSIISNSRSAFDSIISVLKIGYSSPILETRSVVDILTYNGQEPVKGILEMNMLITWIRKLKRNQI